MPPGKFGKPLENDPILGTLHGGQMLKIFLDDNRTVYRILCIGSHCDDLEIGCGGTILRLAKTLRNVKLLWIVFSAGGQRKKEAMNSAKLFLDQIEDKQILFHDFRDGFFPYHGDKIKDYFENLKKKYSPDIIFTHYRNDFHQDHRLLSELTWNTFRSNLILEYEIPKYDGDFGSPNFFVHLDETICRKKINTIMKSYQSQSKRQWFTEDTFFSVMRLRGVESNSPTRFAEGFYCRKIVY